MTSIELLRWITLTSIFFWLVVYWQGGLKIIVDIKEAIRSQNSRLDMALLIIMTLCSFGTISIATLAMLRLLQIVFLDHVAIVFIGTSLSIFGIAGTFYCRHYLGRFWTAETNVSQDHQVIDTGPYRFVRHPIYTFAILLYAGFGMVFLSLWNMPFIGVIVIAYLLKARDEDVFLERTLSGFRAYKLRVRYRLVPGVW